MKRGVDYSVHNKERREVWTIPYTIEVWNDPYTTSSEERFWTDPYTAEMWTIPYTKTARRGVD